MENGKLNLDPEQIRELLEDASPSSMNGYERLAEEIENHYKGLGVMSYGLSLMGLLLLIRNKDAASRLVKTIKNASEIIEETEAFIVEMKKTGECKPL